MKNELLSKEIIKRLYFGKSLSIASLSHVLSRSIPVVLKAVNSLIDQGRVIELGLAPSTGGRRALHYALKPGSQYTVAVAMDQFITRMALIDVDNKIVGLVSKTELPLVNNAESVTILTRLIGEFIDNIAISKTKIVGIGIGMPGFVDVKKGLNHTFLNSQNQSIIEKVEAATGLPVFIDNDSSIIALAELRFGNCREMSNALVVNIGWGIGLGMILNSRLFRGANGFAGEFSHIALFDNRKLCSCGKTGCLETETSLVEIIEKARTGLYNGRVSVLKGQIETTNIEDAFEKIVNAADKGDQYAVELISRAAYEIGRGISILIHLFNPEVIILSGRGATAGKLWEAPVQQAINEFCIPRLAAHTRIEMSLLDYDAELIGAAALVMENFESIGTRLYRNTSGIFN